MRAVFAVVAVLTAVGCASLVGVEDVELGAGGSGGGSTTSLSSTSTSTGSARCGDGIIEDGEACDGVDLGGSDCVTVTGVSDAVGTLGCSSECKFDPSNCAYCGNGRVDAREQCDGDDLGGMTCARHLNQPTAKGPLGCTATCQFDVSRCYCGNGVVDHGEACDGDDLDEKDCSVVAPGAHGSLKCSPYCQLDTTGCSPSIDHANFGGLQKGSPWPMWRGGPTHAGRTDKRLAKTLKLSWFFDGIQPHSQAVVDKDGTIYVGSVAPGGVWAITPDGKEKWHANMGPVKGCPAIGRDGTIYAASEDGNLYALDDDGNLVWTFAPSDGTDATSHASPTIGEDRTIYYVTFDGNLRAINTDGTEKWMVSVGHGDSYSSLQSVAIGREGSLYLSQIDMVNTPGSFYFYGLNPSDGSQKWQVPIGGLLSEVSSVIGADDTIYYGGHAFLPDGTVLGDSGGSWGSWGTTIAANGVLVSAQGNAVAGFATADTPSLWRTVIGGDEQLTAPLIDRDGVFFGGTFGGSVALIYVATPSAVLATYEVMGSIDDAPSVGLDGSLLVASSNEGLYSFAPP